jgi:hypothetical protein
LQTKYIKYALGAYANQIRVAGEALCTYWLHMSKANGRHTFATFFRFFVSTDGSALVSPVSLAAQHSQPQFWHMTYGQLVHKLLFWHCNFGKNRSVGTEGT